MYERQAAEMKARLLAEREKDEKKKQMRLTASRITTDTTMDAFLGSDSGDDRIETHEPQDNHPQGTSEKQTKSDSHHHHSHVHSRHPHSSSSSGKKSKARMTPKLDDAE